LVRIRWRSERGVTVEHGGQRKMDVSARADMPIVTNRHELSDDVGIQDLGIREPAQIDVAARTVRPRLATPVRDRAVQVEREGAGSNTPGGTEQRLDSGIELST